MGYCKNNVVTQRKQKKLSFIKRLFITDWLVIFYIIFVIVWTIAGRAYIEAPNALLLKYLGVILYVAIVLLLSQFWQNRITEILRFWYPVTLLEFFFSSSTELDLVVYKDYLDPFFQNLDERIFGYQPSIVWGEAYPQFFWQEFFHFAYFSYYLMIFGVPLYIYLKREKGEFIRALFNILFVFIACFLVFIFIPVIGARSFEIAKELTETYRYGLFTHIMVFIYRNTSHLGGAFPSSHVAIALTISLLSFRLFRKIGWLLVINTIFLSISTVFCHYHYFVDVVAGVVFGGVMFMISEYMYPILPPFNHKDTRFLTKAQRK
jgi:membrane-associated phospholipid phosphatase